MTVWSENEKIKISTKHLDKVCQKAAFYVVLVFLIASVLGVDAATIVALLGSAGVAIGLAVQGSLSNLAGGVLILLLKPFKVGDYIMASSAGQEGTVSEIQVFYTKLTTPDNRVVILPNGSLANNCIVNVTMESFRRLDVPVSISYRADLDQAKAVLTDMLEHNQYVAQEKEKRVIVDALAESGVNLIVRFWATREDYWNGKFDVTEKCKRVLEEAGVEIPYPQLDVHMKSDL